METFITSANRGSISTGYEIPGSIKFEEDNLEGMYAQPTAAGNRRTWTVSLWFKRTELTTSGHYHALILAKVGSESGSVYITPTDEIICDVGYGGTRNRQQTTMKFRDTSAWYHIVWRVDTTQSTAADRHRLYVNGVLQEWTTIDGYPAQNFESFWNNNIPIYVGIYGTLNNYGACAYIAEIHHTDGISNAPTEFGKFDEDSGIWKPIKYEGNYGAQGVYLPFDDSSAIGKNGHGNDVNFTLQNIAAADYSTDTPTNNFCTFNPANMSGNTAKLAEGSTFTASTANGAFTTYGTMAPSAGKWWWEGKIQVFADTAYACIGATTNLAGLPSVSAQLSGGHVIKLAKAQKWVLNDTGYNYGTAYSDGDYINVGLDLDNRKFYTYKNGTIDDANGIDISSSTFDGYGDQWMPLVITYGSGGASSYEINFGGYRTYSISSPQSDANGYGTFEYAPPTGFYALCTKNLAEYG